MEHDLPDRVRQFVCEFSGMNPHDFRSGTRLEDDLGMTGDDAAEFLEAFAEEFEADLTGIEFHKHFDPEGIPLLFWPPGLANHMKDLGHFPVTIGHLIEVASAKRWFCPPRHGTKKWPNLPPSGVWDRELDG
jgi:hypothetical protein